MNKKGTLLGLLSVVIAVFLLNRLLPHLANTLVTLGIVCVIAMVVIGILVVFSGFSSAKKEAEKTQGIKASQNKAKLSEDEERIINTSNKLLLDEKLLAARIRNTDVRASLSPVLDKADKIIKVLKSEPAKIPDTKQFLNYYIPTLDVILKKFLKLEANNVALNHETEKIISYLSDIRRAMDRQYENLFKRTKLDLSVEMEAMTLAFKRDGLITESDYKPEEKAEDIELTI